MTENEEFEFRARMEAEQAQAAPQQAAAPKVKARNELPQKSAFEEFGQMNLDALNAVDRFGKNLGAGAVRGAGSIGATLMYPIDKITDMVQGDRGRNLQGLIDGKQPQSRNEQRRAQMDDTLKREFGADTDSLAYKGGKIGAEIAGTAGVGGGIANVVGRAAPALAATQTGGKVLSAIASGGFKTGAPAAETFLGRAADVGIRSAGGAINGAVSAGLADPKNAKMGAVIGGALPPTLKVLGEAGKYAGGAAKSLIQPLTKNGQQQIAANVMREFGQGGPMAINTAEIVPGSLPTLAEATGNAGLAGLQRAARAMNQNPFVEREMANNAARTAVFNDVAGDVGKLDFFRAQRAEAGKQLYKEALDVVPPPPTPYLKGQITQLLKRPSITRASKQAQEFALERGDKPYMNGSMQGLHDTKTALDDLINEATTKGRGGHAKALQATQDKLVQVMESLSPAYKEARTTYAQMSQPVNAMEALQGMRVTNKFDNLTLSQMKTALENLERSQAAPGFNAAKSVTGEQVRSLKQIRDDLLRAESTNLGKPAGSDTFQNLATKNMLDKFLPGPIGGAIKDRVGTVAERGAQLVYGGANEKIKNNLVDMMLDPEMARRALSLGGTPMNPRLAALLEKTGQLSYRAAPQLGPNR